MFITFEGVEGCGKSTQAKMLSDILAQRNIKARLTREPGGCKASEAIREVLLGEEWPKLETKSEIFLNFAARVEHVAKTIKPALENGEIVICDRFFDSTLAYQGYGFGGDLDFIRSVNKMAIGDFEPDVTFLIDVPVEVSFARIEGRKGNNRYEKLDLDFHKRTREGFLKMAQESSRIEVIDGTQSMDEVGKEILKRIEI